MKRYFLFVVVLFATSSAFAQVGTNVIKSFTNAVGASSSAVRITNSPAARLLISQATSARIAGVTFASLNTVNAFESAITSILNSNDAAFKTEG